MFLKAHGKSVALGLMGNTWVGNHSKVPSPPLHLPDGIDSCMQSWYLVASRVRARKILVQT